MNLKLSLEEAVDGKIDLLHKIRMERNRHVGTPKQKSDVVTDEIDVAMNAPIYCWDEDIVGAILQSALSLPDDATIRRHLSPTPSGWWWFGKENSQLKGRFSLPELVGYEEQRICAITYKWGSGAIAITAYTYDHRESTYGPVPIWMGTWTEGDDLTSYFKQQRDVRVPVLEEELEDLRKSARFQPEYQLFVEERLKEHGGLWSENDRLISTFFLAASHWMRQTILEDPVVDTPRSVKKRATRVGVSHSIRYVRLRKTVKTKAPTEGEAKKVAWKCQWIVEGFWRNQKYPSKKGTPEEHRLIWINDFVKGPNDKPLKNPGGKLFVVDR